MVSALARQQGWLLKFSSKCCKASKKENENENENEKEKTLIKLIHDKCARLSLSWIQ